MHFVAKIMALMLALAATSSHAAIKFDFNGVGVVTFAHDGINYYDGSPAYARPVRIGQAAYISGDVVIVTGNDGEPISNSFTGRVTLAFNDLFHYGSSYNFVVRNGGVSGDSIAVNPSAYVDLLRGKLVDFSFDADDDGQTNFLDAYSFAYYRGSAGNGGTWQLLNARAVGVPEPASWIMMATGFAALGFFRRRAVRSPLPAYGIAIDEPA